MTAVAGISHPSVKADADTTLERLQRVRLIASTGLLMTTTITWRAGVYYSGGIDPVVAGKAVLGLVAAYLALSAAGAARERHVNLSSVVFLLAFALVSTIGAWATGALFFASAVLCLRLALLAVTAYALVRAYDPLRLLRAFCGWLAASALAAAATGTTAGSLRTGFGRLIGGIPPLQPNDIAQLCAFAVIVMLWSDLRNQARRGQGVLVLMLLAVLWLTQSRTTLAFLVLALLVLVFVTRRLKFGFVLSLLALVPVVVFVGLGTSAASHLVNRGGKENVLSLSQRTVAWSAALHVHTGFWQVWFGNGLARTSIPVVAQYRTQQILDSSWVSALVQTGVLGLALLAAWVSTTVVRAWRAPREVRSLYLPLIVLIVGLSVLESGLIGATPSFVIFLVISLTAIPAPHNRDRAEELRMIFKRPAQDRTQFELR